MSKGNRSYKAEKRRKELKRQEKKRKKLEKKLEKSRSQEMGSADSEYSQSQEDK